MNGEADNLLSAVQAAKRLGIHPGTLANWRAWGLGPKFVRIGRLVRYRLEDVKAFKREGSGADGRSHV